MRYYVVDFEEGCHGIGGIIMGEERIEFTPEQQAYVDALIAEKLKDCLQKKI